jgi:hypothetical protein
MFPPTRLIHFEPWRDDQDQPSSRQDSVQGQDLEDEQSQEKVSANRFNAATEKIKYGVRCYAVAGAMPICYYSVNDL